jgi:hypothetical protein
METTRPNPILRLMPSLNDVAFLIPILFLFTRMEGVRTLLGDGDTGWHVRTGEWILDHGRVPSADIFSFTKPGQPWYAWEWLWDVAFAWMHRNGGMALVVIASLLVLCTTFMLLYRLVNRCSGNPIVAIGLTALAAAGSTIHWLARPHLFTLLFTVIFLTILESVREGRTRLLWSLPAITVLWTNLHGGFPVGILILVAYAGGEIARSLVASTREERADAFRASLPYFSTAAGCLAASLVNPYFYRLHQHMWEYLRDPYETKNIVEFQSANFRNGAAGFFEAMLLLSVGAAIWYGARKQFGPIFLLGGWAHLALLSARNIPIFMIVAAPVVGVAMVAWIRALANGPLAGWVKKAAETFQDAADDMVPFENVGRAHLVSVFAFAVIFLGMSSPTAGKFLKPEFDPKAYPSGAMPLLESSQHVFTHDEWGDYLIYQGSPRGLKVYVDGRSDFYGGKFCQEYIELLNVRYDWEKLLARYGVDTVLLPPDSPLASAIKESRNWRVVYDDGSAIVFRAADKAGVEHQQASTSGIGGRGRDLTVTKPQTAIPTDRGSQSTGADQL